MQPVFAKTMKLAMASMALTSLGSFAYGMVTSPGTYRIEIKVTGAERADLAKGKKTDVPRASLVIFQGADQIGDFSANINTRGVTSLSTYPRKNFNVKSIPKKVGEKAKKIKIGSVVGKELVLSASPEDVLGTKNMLAYGLLDAVGIRALKPQYAEVVLNGISQGLYFVTKTAGDEVLEADVVDKNGNQIENPYEVVIRRRYGDTFDADLKKDGNIKVKGNTKGLSREKILEYVKTLNEIHMVVDNGVMNGEGRLAALSKNLNLKNYMKWMAMNYILKNGDYSDEVFFFGKTDSGGNIQFDVMPWDQDDSFGSEMHQAGIVASINHGLEEKGIADKTLVYNFESRIDRTIGTDPVLLRKYFEVVSEVIETLRNKGSLDSVVAGLKARLAPYMEYQEIMDSGKLDKSAAVYERDAILAELDGRVTFINDRMTKAEAQIAASANISDNDLAPVLGRLHEKIGQTFLDTMARIAKRKALKAREEIKESKAAKELSAVKEAAAQAE